MSLFIYDKRNILILRTYLVQCYFLINAVGNLEVGSEETYAC